LFLLTNLFCLALLIDTVDRTSLSTVSPRDKYFLSWKLIFQVTVFFQSNI